MRPLCFIGLALAFLACGLSTDPVPAQEKEKKPDPLKRAAFEAVRWVPEVKIDGQWYRLRAIDDVPVQDILDFIHQVEDDRWPRRFAEDLVEMLNKMGNPPGETVKLLVRNVETGEEKTLDKAPLNKANRDALLALRDQLRAKPLPPIKPPVLDAALTDLKKLLDERWSYRHANRADFDAAIESLREKSASGISTFDFGVELEKIIGLGIDGHAGVEGNSRIKGNYLPFLLAAEGERVVAFKPTRSGFLAEGFPYLTKIDGTEISRWCEAVAVLRPRGSPQFVRRHALENLRNLDFVRGMMKWEVKPTVEVELASADGKDHKTLTLPTAPVFSLSERWPSGGSRLLEGNVGYLRLSDMRRVTSVPEIRKWMPNFKDTAGLVVDVRDNSGGDRDALLLLYSYFAAPDAPPRVFTAAAYRLHPEHRENHLTQRFMYRADAKEWTDQERRAVAEFANRFKPEWEPPKGQFSDWHYLALSRSNDKEIYHYAKPVVVLMNARCFSATDIFLAGLKGMPKVTLLGTPSGGGSALIQEFPVGSTPFTVRLGSMASFQADGKLFDGNGVTPDVVVEPVPEYHLGTRDNQLEEAVRRIK